MRCQTVSSLSFFCPWSICYHWRELPQVAFLSRQTRVCCDKNVFFATNIVVVATKVCDDILVKGRSYMNQSKSVLLMALVLPLKLEGERNIHSYQGERLKSATAAGLKVMMIYYVRELYQKQHHRRSWRKRHSFDLHSAKNGGGIRVYATSGEAKREGVSRPHASLRRLSVKKVPVPPAVHI